MEAFSLLKYWRGGGAALPLPLPAAAPASAAPAAPQNDIDTDTDDEGDDGPFFDLEFTLPEDSPQNPNGDAEHHSESEENDSTSEDEDGEDDSVSEADDDGESEIKFTLSPSSNDPERSSGEDVVLKGKLVELVEPNSKPGHQLTASFLKSANKLRVFKLGLKKPKPNNSEPRQQRKLFTVKFKVEEVPIMSLFSKGAAKSVTASANKEETQTQTQTLSSVSEEKRSVHKYLRMVKPLYVRVSRRYAEKLRFSGQINVSDSAAAEKEGDAAVAEAAGVNGKGQGQSQSQSQSQRQGNLPLPAGLRVVCKHLGKSRSASSMEAAAAELASSKRRDDSLLQQQDGIQGAILHCKRSFNASRECESSQLPRSVSDPLHEVSSSPELSRKSTNEGK